MPANTKYLLQSPWARTSKIIAAIFGCLIASIVVHLALALWVDLSTFLSISIYGTFILWVAFILTIYWIKSPWKSWGMLLAVIAIGSVAIYFGKG
ncbi:MAG: hypothetical protein AAGJ18_09750 [Bacteroidota bacterium]